MFRVSNEAGDSDITKFGDSTEFVSPPQKKQKTDTEAKVDAEVKPEKRILRRGNWDDPEYAKQRMIFEEQFKNSEGYDVDWSKVDYNFPAVNFDWGSDFDDQMSNEELMKQLIKTAIDEENEETGTKLEFVKYVSANVLGVQGFLFYITFWAKDLSSPNPEPQCYQAKVRKFMGEIDVSEFRLRPTQE
ncbi:unnamed protein product [Arabidopsis lyrata]|nr:uncharacterized protein LOC9306287 [Arabidopsis lyrata subsp. lyrata]CAH8276522.1 unnamed protein product [Arabidopsis lyrata]|eukprot:XP_020875320.1 uncharacterized protein LOC9306287 [Arabidopsis lyrata subsp. lyrata]